MLIHFLNDKANDHNTFHNEQVFLLKMVLNMIFITFLQKTCLVLYLESQAE